MTGEAISHYKILEKLGEVPKSSTSASQRMVGILRILDESSRRPTFSVGSYGGGDP
jgi:hypothetical protein